MAIDPFTSAAFLAAKRASAAPMTSPIPVPKPTPEEGLSLADIFAGLGEAASAVEIPQVQNKPLPPVSPVLGRSQLRPDVMRLLAQMMLPGQQVQIPTLGKLIAGG